MRRSAFPRFPGALWMALLLLAAAAPRAAWAADPRPEPQPIAANLLAHGSHDTHGGMEYLWVARVAKEPEPGDESALRTRIFALQAGDSAWQQWSSIGARVVSIASRGTELAVLLDDGSWELISSDSTSTGERLPVDGAELVTISDDGHSIWGIARIPGGLAKMEAPSTTPAPETEPSTPSTTPATRPASGPVLKSGPETMLTLVHLGTGGWQGVADVPAAPENGVSLSMIADEPWLAVRDHDHVRILRLGATGNPTSAPSTTRPAVATWSEFTRFDLPANSQEARLLDGTPNPTLWARGLIGPDHLYFCDKAGIVPPAMPMDGAASSPTDQRAATYALGHLLSIFARNNVLYEQQFDRINGAAAGQPVPLLFPQTHETPLTFWRYALVTGAMLFAIGASFRRREQIRSLNLDPATLPLAPMAPRLLAGAIDAIPVIAAWIFYYQRLGLGEVLGALTGGQTQSSPMVEAALWVSFVIYLLHTLGSELLTGRTIGKIIVGLHVSSIDGEPPSRSQIVTRNLLRIIDAGLVFLPALLVPFSPLRQRAGDTAAGTLVVTTRKPAKVDAEDKG